VPLKNPNELDLVPRRTRAAWVFAAAVAVAGAATGAIYGGLIGAAQRLPPLTLRPYVDLSWLNPVTRWMAPAFASPFLAAAALGVAAGALVLLCDAILRHAFLAPKPGAAALAAVLVLVSPGCGTLLRLEGHWGVLAGAALGAIACVLVLEDSGFLWWIGCVFGGCAVVLHPVWAGLLVALPLLARISRGGTARAAGVVLVAVVAGVGLLFLRETQLDTGLLPMRDRLWLAARDLAAAPVLAFSTSRRFDLPTGFEALTWTWPVAVGLAVHALLLGIAMMIGGVRRGAAAALTGALGAVMAAVLLPGWVPGDRAFALAAMIPYAVLAALVLAAFPERVGKAVFPGLLLGAGVVAVLLASDRAPNWTALGAAMDLPRQRLGTGPIMAVEAERDPARLVLFVNAASLRDAYAPSVVEAADKLMESKAPALFPDRLKLILDKLMNRVGKPRRTPEFKKLAADVAGELKLIESLWGQSVVSNFDVVGQSLVDLTPRALELALNWSGEIEGRMTAQAYLRMARSVLPVAGAAAYYEYSIPLLEAIQLIGPELDDTAATLGLQRVYAGDRERGREELRGLVRKLGPKSPTTGVVRGILGMLELQDGNPAAALKELQPAWGAIAPGGVKGVQNVFTPDTVDYYVIAEILLARYEAARSADAVLAPQAARDLVDLLDQPLRFGVRRLPALAIMGKLQLLLGEREKAIQLLREARNIPFKSLDDRGQGPVGRIAHPRYRRLALETLLSALMDDASAAAERDEIGAELQQLAPK
jgi:hypothetical protein